MKLAPRAEEGPAFTAMACTFEAGVEPGCDDSAVLLLPPPHPKTNIEAAANPNGRKIREEGSLIVSPPAELPLESLEEDRLSPSKRPCDQPFARRARAAGSGKARDRGAGSVEPGQPGHTDRSTRRTPGGGRDEIGPAKPRQKHSLKGTRTPST